MKKCLLLLLAVAFILGGCKDTALPEPSSELPTEHEISPPPADVSATPADVKTPEPVRDGSVKTDYSGLTEHERPRPKYTRLSDGPLPGLVPRDDYGLLMTYIGSRTGNDWYSTVSRYGLATTDGMIVTDAVYTGAYVLGSGDNSCFVLTTVSENVNEYGYNYPMRALCALDGSWITPFYASDEVFHGDNVIIIIGNSDEDRGWRVFNYSGIQLYYKEDLLPQNAGDEDFYYYLHMPERCGWFTIWTKGNKVVLVNAYTGEAVSTDYDEITGFFNGMCGVEKNGLWGFINADLELVIEPQFLQLEWLWEGNFFDERAICMKPDGSYVVIDKGGNVLFENAGRLGALMNRNGIYGYAENLHSDNEKHYYIDFTPLPEGHKLVDKNTTYTISSDGMTLYHGGKELFLEGVTDVYDSEYGIYRIYFESGEASAGYGLATMDDGIIFRSENGYAVYGIQGRELMIVETRSSSYSTLSTLYSLDGTRLLSAYGYIGYNERLGLFSIQTDGYSSYYSTEFELVFCYIPLSIGED